MEYAPSSQTYDIWALMARAHYEMHILREAELKDMGLSMSKVRLLNAIWQQNEAGINPTPSQVAKLTMKAPSTITESLDRLQNQGLITRTPDPKKKRMIRLALTELGKEVYLKTREAETLKRIVSKLTPKKREALASSLRVLYKNARKENELNSPLF